mgnify:CR=1 FL=1
MNSDHINQFWIQFNEKCTKTRELTHHVSNSLDYNEIPPLKTMLSEIQE